MSVYKDESTNTWRVIFRYTDHTGKSRQLSHLSQPSRPSPRIPRPHDEIRRVQRGQAGRKFKTSPCQRTKKHEHYGLRMV